MFACALIWGSAIAFNRFRERPSEFFEFVNGPCARDTTCPVVVQEAWVPLTPSTDLPDLNGVTTDKSQLEELNDPTRHQVAHLFTEGATVNMTLSDSTVRLATQACRVLNKTVAQSPYLPPMPLIVQDGVQYIHPGFCLWIEVDYENYARLSHSGCWYGMSMCGPAWSRAAHDPSTPNSELTLGAPATDPYFPTTYFTGRRNQTGAQEKLRAMGWSPFSCENTKDDPVCLLEKGQTYGEDVAPPTVVLGVDEKTGNQTAEFVRRTFRTNGDGSGAGSLPFLSFGTSSIDDDETTQDCGAGGIQTIPARLEPNECKPCNSDDDCSLNHVCAVAVADDILGTLGEGQHLWLLGEAVADTCLQQDPSVGPNTTMCIPRNFPVFDRLGCYFSGRTTAYADGGLPPKDPAIEWNYVSSRNPFLDYVQHMHRLTLGLFQIPQDIQMPRDKLKEKLVRLDMMATSYAGWQGNPYLNALFGSLRTQERDNVPFLQSVAATGVMYPKRDLNRPWPWDAIDNYSIGNPTLFLYPLTQLTSEINGCSRDEDDSQLKIKFWQCQNYPDWACPAPPVCQLSSLGGCVSVDNDLTVLCETAIVGISDKYYTDTPSITNLTNAKPDGVFHADVTTFAEQCCELQPVNHLVQGPNTKWTRSGNTFTQREIPYPVVKTGIAPFVTNDRCHGSTQSLDECMRCVQDTGESRRTWIYNGNYSIGFGSPEKDLTGVPEVDNKNAILQDRLPMNERGSGFACNTNVKISTCITNNFLHHCMDGTCPIHNYQADSGAGYCTSNNYGTVDDLAVCQKDPGEYFKFDGPEEGDNDDVLVAYAKDFVCAPLYHEYDWTLYDQSTEIMFATGLTMVPDPRVSIYFNSKATNANEFNFAKSAIVDNLWTAPGADAEVLNCCPWWQGTLQNCTELQDRPDYIGCIQSCDALIGYWSLSEHADELSGRCNWRASDNVKAPNAKSWRDNKNFLYTTVTTDAVPNQVEFIDGKWEGLVWETYRGLELVNCKENFTAELLVFDAAPTADATQLHVVLFGSRDISDIFQAITTDDTSIQKVLPIEYVFVDKETTLVPLSDPSDPCRQTNSPTQAFLSNAVTGAYDVDTHPHLESFYPTWASGVMDYGLLSNRSHHVLDGIAGVTGTNDPSATFVPNSYSRGVNFQPTTWDKRVLPSVNSEAFRTIHGTTDLTDKEEGPGPAHASFVMGSTGGAQYISYVAAKNTQPGPGCGLAKFTASRRALPRQQCMWREMSESLERGPPFHVWNGLQKVGNTPCLNSTAIDLATIISDIGCLTGITEPVWLVAGNPDSTPVVFAVNGTAEPQACYSDQCIDFNTNHFSRIMLWNSQCSTLPGVNSDAPSRDLKTCAPPNLKKRYNLDTPDQYRPHRCVAVQCGCRAYPIKDGDTNPSESQGCTHQPDDESPPVRDTDQCFEAGVPQTQLGAMYGGKASTTTAPMDWATQIKQANYRKTTYVDLGKLSPFANSLRAGIGDVAQQKQVERSGQSTMVGNLYNVDINTPQGSIFKSKTLNSDAVCRLPLSKTSGGTFFSDFNDDFSAPLQQTGNIYEYNFDHEELQDGSADAHITIYDESDPAFLKIFGSLYNKDFGTNSNVKDARAETGGLGYVVNSRHSAEPLFTPVGLTYPADAADGQSYTGPTTNRQYLPPTCYKGVKYSPSSGGFHTQCSNRLLRGVSSKTINSFRFERSHAEEQRVPYSAPGCGTQAGKDSKHKKKCDMESAGPTNLPSNPNPTPVAPTTYTLGNKPVNTRSGAWSIGNPTGTGGNCHCGVVRNGQDFVNYYGGHSETYTGSSVPFENILESPAYDNVWQNLDSSDRPLDKYPLFMSMDAGDLDQTPVMFAWEGNTNGTKDFGGGKIWRFGGGDVSPYPYMLGCRGAPNHCQRNDPKYKDNRCIQYCTGTPIPVNTSNTAIRPLGHFQCGGNEICDAQYEDQCVNENIQADVNNPKCVAYMWRTQASRPDNGDACFIEFKYPGWGIVDHESAPLPPADFQYDSTEKSRFFMGNNCKIGQKLKRDGVEFLHLTSNTRAFPFVTPDQSALAHESVDESFGVGCNNEASGWTQPGQAAPSTPFEYTVESVQLQVYSSNAQRVAGPVTSTHTGLVRVPRKSASGADVPASTPADYTARAWLEPMTDTPDDKALCLCGDGIEWACMALDYEFYSVVYGRRFGKDNHQAFRPKLQICGWSWSGLGVTGAFNAMPGLYIGSEHIGVDAIERDFMGRDDTKQSVFSNTFVRRGQPLPRQLQDNIGYHDKWQSTSHVMKYPGGCVRSPFGLIHHQLLQNPEKYYLKNNSDGTLTTSDHGDETLYTYCEQLDAGKVVMCKNDPLSHARRVEFCNQHRDTATKLFLGQTAGDYLNPCFTHNQAAVCVFYPDNLRFRTLQQIIETVPEEQASTVSIVIAPFSERLRTTLQFAIKSFDTAQSRYTKTGFANLNTYLDSDEGASLPPQFATVTSDFVLTECQFLILNDVSAWGTHTECSGSDLATNAKKELSGIYAGLQEMPSQPGISKWGSKCVQDNGAPGILLPYVTANNTNTPDTATSARGECVDATEWGPTLTSRGHVIDRNHVTIHSALANQPIVVPPVSDDTETGRSESVCNALIIRGTNVMVDKLTVDQSGCSAGLHDAVAVVFSGTSVANASLNGVTVTTTQSSSSAIAVGFLGGDALYGPASQTLDVSDVTVKIVQNLQNKFFDIAFAHTTAANGTVNVPTSARVLVQEGRKDMFTDEVWSRTAPEVVDIAQLTATFGLPFEKRYFHPAPNHNVIIGVVTSVLWLIALVMVAVLVTIYYRAAMALCEV